LELTERFPQFNYESKSHKNMVGLLEPNAGFVRCEHVLKAAMSQTMAECRTKLDRDSNKEEEDDDDNDDDGSNENSIISIMENACLKSFYEVTTTLGSTLVELHIDRDDTRETEVVTTRTLLVSAGGWTGQLIPSWALYLRPTRQIQGWIDVSRSHPAGGGPSPDSSIFSYEHMPAFVMITPDWPKPLYGLPCDSDDPDYIYQLKVGIHGREELIFDPSNNSQTATSAEIDEIKMATRCSIDSAAWGHEALRLHQHEQPHVNESSLPVIADTKPCLYTMTPDSQYMIGTPEGYKRVFVVAGLSGHGFKNTPALGQMMADFALGKDVKLNWQYDFCAPSRFK
jgi:glycine/D-amino acid oxidase-like deaminating enzyme